MPPKEIQYRPPSGTVIEVKQNTVRRSSRVKKEERINYVQMGNGENQEEIQQERFDRKSPKGRKRERSRKKYMKYKTRIEGLLTWKKELKDVSPPKQGEYKLQVVRNICKAELSKFAQNLQGLFINIRWSESKPKIGKGITMEQFKKLKIQDTKLLSNGIVFVWVEKQVMIEVIEVMAEKGFVHIEGFQIVFLDLEKGMEELNKAEKRIMEEEKEREREQKRKSKGKSKGKEKEKDKSKPKEPRTSHRKDKEQRPPKNTRSQNEEVELSEKMHFLANMGKLADLDPKDIIVKVDSFPLKKSKTQLMMFRKFPKKRNHEPLELRHQRTCDVVFDIVSPHTLALDRITMNYIYDMIQTLLPKSIGETFETFQLMELWGDKRYPRTGWVTVAQK